MSTTSTLSPNMSLVVPTVGQEPGPTYATDLNSSLLILDQHNHSFGSGVQINPSGLNINSALTFNNNFATNVAGVTLTAQSSTPSSGSVYRSGNDLYYNNGAGTNIQLTNSSGVAITPQSIPGLVSPASATYIPGSETFVWQSNTSIAANMDFGSAIFRNLSPNSTYGVTVNAPASLANNYSLNLPLIPSSTSFVTLDTSGNISGSVSTNNGITRPNLAAVGQQISSGSGGFSTTSTSYVQVTNLSVTITTSGRPIIIIMQPDTAGNASGIFASSTVSGTYAPPSLGLFRGSTFINSFITLAGFFDFPTSAFVHYLPASTIFYLDPQSAGTYTYTVQAHVPNTTMTIGVVNCVLVAYEL